jgi:hypothetical protein
LLEQRGVRGDQVQEAAVQNRIPHLPFERRGGRERACATSVVGGVAINYRVGEMTLANRRSSIVPAFTTTAAPELTQGSAT